MKAYFIERILLTTLPTLLTIAVLTFAVTRVFIPPSTKALMVDYYGRQHNELGAKIDLEVGLKRETPGQFAQWLGIAWVWGEKKGILEGDFGTSLYFRNAVTSEILDHVPATVELAVLAQIFALIMAIPLGVIAGLNRDRWPDRLLGAVVRLSAFPSLILAVYFIVFVAIWFNWRAPPMYRFAWRDPFQELKTLWLPSILMALTPLGVFVRLTRHQMIAVLDDPSPGTNVGRMDRIMALRRTHVRSALVPIVLASAASVQLLIGVTLLHEQMFDVPGIGRVALDATNNLDYPILSGLILVLGAICVLIARLAELACAYLMSGQEQAGADPAELGLRIKMYRQ